MNLIDLLSSHNGFFLYAFIFAEAVGLPLPVVPVLLVAGALAHNRAINPLLAFYLPAFALTIGDLVWFNLGQTRGTAVLRLLCKIALEPDACVRQTQNMFIKYGVKSLLVARFVPGLSTVAAPLAGVTKVPLRRFLPYSAAGAIIYTSAYVALGSLFSSEINQIAALAARMGSRLFLALIFAIGSYLALRWYNRRRLIRSLDMPRTSVTELRKKMAGGQSVFIIDVRPEHAAMQAIPGSLRLLPEDISTHLPTLPIDRDIVIYCGCPNEASAAKVALAIKKAGFTRVYPLAGGIDAWLAATAESRAPLAVM